MYHVNEVVLYRGTGVCRITGFTEKRLGDCTQECYTLAPLYLNNLKIFVPYSLEGRIQPVCSSEIISESLKRLGDIDTVWIVDAYVRRKKYREILLDGTQEQMLQVIKTLYIAKQKRQFRGQKGGLCISDDHILHDCLRIISEEFAYGSGSDYSEAEQQVLNVVNECLNNSAIEKVKNIIS